MSKYFNMNSIPIGSLMRVKKNGKEVKLIQIFHYPTTFKTEDENGLHEVFKTHEIEILEPKSSDGNDEPIK